MTPARDGRPSHEVAVPVATLWRSPDAPRGVDEPAVRDRPDVQAWTASLTPRLGLGLHGRVDSQLLMGEAVQVLEERQGWSRVAAPLQESSSHEGGYRGWLRTAHLASAAPVGSGLVARVVDRTATCRLLGDAGSEPLPLSFGTTLPVASVTDESATVLLPGARRGVLPRSRVRVDDPHGPPPPGPEATLAAARLFLGLRYLWGGTSAWGLDCSGLVHLVLRALGVRVPRDAHDQGAAAMVEPVPLAEVQPGDLYFFGRPGRRISHVGWVTRPVAADGARWMLHAPEGGGLVEEAPLSPSRLGTLVAAARPPLAVRSAQ